ATLLLAGGRHAGAGDAEAGGAGRFHRARGDLRSPLSGAGGRAAQRSPAARFPGARNRRLLRGRARAGERVRLRQRRAGGARARRGAPRGGRDQPLARLMARARRGEPASAFLAAGTDGRDGPTSSAGAFVDGATWGEAERRGLQPERALAAFDAARVLEALG